jgi:hypothetical protein
MYYISQYIINRLIFISIDYVSYDNVLPLIYNQTDIKKTTHHIIMLPKAQYLVLHTLCFFQFVILI